MLKRAVTGLTIIAAIIGFFIAAYYVSFIFMDMLILIFLSGAIYEMYHCFKEAGYKIFVAPLVFFLLTAYPVYFLLQYYLGSNMGLQGIIMVTLGSVMFQLTLFTFSKAETHDIKDLFSNVFILVYPALFMTVAWLLNFEYCALFIVPFAVFLPVAGDTFAYFFGVSIGGKKLCPTISPKKTIAGAVGGIFGSIVCAIVFWLFFEMYNAVPDIGYVPFLSHAVDGWEWKTALIYVALGLFGGIFAELGDLAASRIKRSLGVKDYGKIFPGHGGVMDRLDSVLYDIVVLLVALTAIYGF